MSYPIAHFKERCICQSLSGYVCVLDPDKLHCRRTSTGQLTRPAFFKVWSGQNVERVARKLPKRSSEINRIKYVCYLHLNNNKHGAQCKYSNSPSGRGPAGLKKPERLSRGEREGEEKTLGFFHAASLCAQDPPTSPGEKKCSAAVGEREGGRTWLRAPLASREGRRAVIGLPSAAPLICSCCPSNFFFRFTVSARRVVARCTGPSYLQCCRRRAPRPGYPWR